MTIAIERALAETTLPLDVIRHCIMPYTHKDWKPQMHKVLDDLSRVSEWVRSLNPKHQMPTFSQDILGKLEWEASLDGRRSLVQARKLRMNLRRDLHRAFREQQTNAPIPLARRRGVAQ